MTLTDLDPATGIRARDLDRAHVFHSWSAQGRLDPLVIAGAQGSRVWDYDGRTLLDFSSQLVNINIGHQHARVVAAIQEQAERLTTISPAHANLARGEAARRILEKAGPGFDKIFFTNAGADANENAIRMARLHTGRDKVISTYRSYHGNTGAAIAATGDWRRMPNEYARGHVHVFGPYAYRSEFWSESPEQESERALHHLRRVVQAEGADSIAAILLETVPGTAGVLVPPPGYLEGVRRLCDEFGIVMILDEVMSGFGRTGAWFAWQHFGAVPDLVTFAKGVNSGYIPAGGVAISAAIASSFEERVFPGGLTYSGHPLAMAAIVAAIDAMEDEDVVGHAARLGESVLGPGLRDLTERHPSVGDVRGLGVLWAVELVTDRATRQPLSSSRMTELQRRIMAGGVLPLVVENRVHVVPPCTTTADEAREGLAVLDEALTACGL